MLAAGSWATAKTRSRKASDCESASKTDGEPTVSLWNEQALMAILMMRQMQESMLMKDGLYLSISLISESK